MVAQRLTVVALVFGVLWFGSPQAADAARLRPGNNITLRQWRLKHPHRFEISKKRQRIYEYLPNRRKPIVYRTSTASGKMYWHRRKRRMVRAVTPSGFYVIALKRPGWVRSRTVSGSMYYPMFLRHAGGTKVTGMALHGSKRYNIPHDSHGCLRYFWGRSRAVYRRTPIGTPVLIY